MNLSNNDFYYREVAELTASGGWKVDFINKESYLDPQARKILNLSEDFKPSLYKLIDLYAPKHRETAIKTFMDCSEGIPFETTVKMQRSNGEIFWVKAAGKPIYNNDNKIIGVQGVFRDINKEKLVEIEKKKEQKLLQSQNARLLNFAHIVSHNLRSHSSNFQLSLTLLNAVDDETEKKELMDGLLQISESLNTTISHLNEIVSVNSKTGGELKDVSFNEVFNDTINILSDVIKPSKAEFITDFTSLESIDYIPAYMDSIFLNIISNSIKYAHPDRTPTIKITTYTEGEDKLLVFEDNGIGVNLELYGNKIFNMYQTFHNNKNAVGIGLFMTRNQIEALGGTITIESTVDKGTKLKILLN
ncbi:PAS domain-containing sensor histidine kinase [Patiriisocius marinus]|uniref:histidine kinase n=1 Tax=Patiriisocius marinus TaxID=1397112 RepID=A0A5J4IZ41_9FLAO|nr:PAS domain-containing sensor histidine kinase [Patiriisocius marinus]GER58811.1 hypothetical protein ULMA_09190 [Patiriisocius marinus]